MVGSEGVVGVVSFGSSVVVVSVLFVSVGSVTTGSSSTTGVVVVLSSVGVSYGFVSSAGGVGVGVVSSTGVLSGSGSKLTTVGAFSP